MRRTVNGFGMLVMLLLLLWHMPVALASEAVSQVNGNGSGSAAYGLRAQISSHWFMRLSAPSIQKDQPQAEVVGTVSFYCMGEIDGDRSRIAVSEDIPLYQDGEIYYIVEETPHSFIDYFGNEAQMPSDLSQWTVQTKRGNVTGTLRKSEVGQPGAAIVHFEDEAALLAASGEGIALRVTAQEVVPLAYVDISMPMYFDPVDYDYHGNWYYVIKGGSVSDHEGRLSAILNAWENEHGTLLRGKKFATWRDAQGQSLEHVQGDVNLVPSYARAYSVEIWDTKARSVMNEVSLLENETIALADIPAPQKSGYVFTGWSMPGGGEVPEAIRMGTENIRLVASFTELVSVVFEGAHTTQTIQVPAGTAYSALRPVAPDLPEGAAFGRWVEKRSGRAVGEDKAITRTITLSAEYTHTVTFMRGGVVHDVQEVPIGKTVNLANVRPVEGEGIRFEDWLPRDGAHALSQPVYENQVFDAKLAYRVRFVYGMEDEHEKEFYVSASQTLPEDQIPPLDVEGYIAWWDPQDALHKGITSPTEIRACYAPRQEAMEVMSQTAHARGAGP